MFFLYNTFLWIFVVLALPVFLVKLVTTKKYRMGLRQRLGNLPKEELQKIQGSRPIWVHAVSVGETIAAVPLVRELRRQYPESKIVVTTVTATGQLTARSQVKDADAVLFFPFDIPFIVEKVLREIDPSLFLIMETEIWPNCIRLLHRRKVPILLVNGRISSASFRGYSRFRLFMKHVLEMVTAFSMQTEEDAGRILSLGAPREHVCNSGNIKFDRQVLSLSDDEKKRMRHDYLLPEEGDLLIAGSTHPGEEEILAETYLKLKQNFPGLHMILAPRHPERAAEVETLLKEKGIDCQKRSRPESGKPVLLLDTVGELSSLYGIGTVSFVGGSLVPIGGHNILEPAVYGVPVVFGPHMENFPEISAVVKERQGGVQIQDGAELFRVLTDLLSQSSHRMRMGKSGMQVIQENQGALKKTMELARKLYECIDCEVG